MEPLPHSSASAAVDVRVHKPVTSTKQTGSRSSLVWVTLHPFYVSQEQRKDKKSRASAEETDSADGAAEVEARRDGESGGGRRVVVVVSDSSSSDSSSSLPDEEVPPARGSRARRRHAGAGMVGMGGTDFVRVYEEEMTASNVTACESRPMPDLSPSSKEGLRSTSRGSYCGSYFSVCCSWRKRWLSLLCASAEAHRHTSPGHLAASSPAPAPATSNTWFWRRYRPLRWS